MWDLKNADFTFYTELLKNSEWITCFESSLSIDEITSRIAEKVLNCARIAIPNKAVQVRSWDKPWYNGYLRCLKRRLH